MEGVAERGERVVRAMTGAVVAVVAVALGGSACVNIREEADAARKEIEREVAQVMEGTEELADHQTGSLRQVRGAWLGNRVLEGQRGDPLPQALSGVPFALLVAAGPPEGNSRATLIAEVSGLLNVSFAVDPVSLGLVEGEGGEGGEQEAAGVGPGPLEGEEEGEGDPYGALDRFILGGYAEGPLDEDFYFDGQAESLLSAMASALGFSSWMYEGGTVFLSVHEMRDFPIELIAGGASDSIREEVAASIEAICGDCLVQVRPELGRIQVTSRPVMIERVERYLSDLREKLTRQYLIEIEVYSVVREARTSRRLDLDFAFSEGDWGITVGDAGGVLVLGDEGGFGVGGMVDALSSLGHTTITHSSSVVALDGREQRVKLERRDVVKIGEERTVNDQGNVVAVTDVLDEFFDGIELVVKPLGLDHGRLLLAYDLSISSVLVPQPGQDTSEQALKSSVDERKLRNEIILPVGSRVVFNAFERARVGTVDDGALSPEMWFLGGGVEGSRVVETLVVALRTGRADLSQVLASGG